MPASVVERTDEINEDCQVHLNVDQTEPKLPTLGSPSATHVTDSPEAKRRRGRVPSFISVLIIVTALLSSVVLNAMPWLFEGFTFCGWLGLTLGLALACRSGWASSFWVTWLWCSIVLGIAFHWSPAAMAYTLSSDFALGFAVAAPLFIWDGLRFALGFWFASKLTRDPRYSWFAAAMVTIGLEYTMPGVFPWKIGMIQLSNPWLLQGVEVFGASFSSFVAFAFAGAIQIVVLNAYRWLVPSGMSVSQVDNAPQNAYSSKSILNILLAPATLTVLGICLFNAIAWSVRSNELAAASTVRVGLIQVDPSYTESTENARSLTASIADQVDLVCWPESSAGNYDLRLSCLSDEAKNFELSREPERGLRPWPDPSCELLIGGKNYSGDDEATGELYVTAMLIDTNESITCRHNKRFLMPFGEYVPGEKYVPGLAQLFDMAEYVQPGKTAFPIDSATGARIGAMLCYEDMVPRAARDMVTNRANLLVSLANGSAFESPFTLYQHRLIAHMRAIECRRYFVRCAATGETCVINPLGEIGARLPMQTNAALVAQVGLLDGKRFTVDSRGSHQSQLSARLLSSA